MGGTASELPSPFCPRTENIEQDVCERRTCFHSISRLISHVLCKHGSSQLFTADTRAQNLNYRSVTSYDPITSLAESPVCCLAPLMVYSAVELSDQQFRQMMSQDVSLRMTTLNDQDAHQHERVHSRRRADPDGRGCMVRRSSFLLSLRIQRFSGVRLSIFAKMSISVLKLSRCTVPKIVIVACSISAAVGRRMLSPCVFRCGARSFSRDLYHFALIY